MQQHTLTGITVIDAVIKKGGDIVTLDTHKRFYDLFLLINHPDAFLYGYVTHPHLLVSSS